MKPVDKFTLSQIWVQLKTQKKYSEIVPKLWKYYLRTPPLYMFTDNIRVEVRRQFSATKTRIQSV